MKKRKKYRRKRVSEPLVPLGTPLYVSPEIFDCYKRKEMNLKQVLICQHIDFLVSKGTNGVCFASNRYFMELLQCGERAFQLLLEELIDNGFVTAYYSRAGKFVVKRLLYTRWNPDPYS